MLQFLRLKLSMFMSDFENETSHQENRSVFCSWPIFWKNVHRLMRHENNFPDIKYIFFFGRFVSYYEFKTQSGASRTNWISTRRTWDHIWWWWKRTRISTDSDLFFLYVDDWCGLVAFSNDWQSFFAWFWICKQWCHSQDKSRRFILTGNQWQEQKNQETSTQMNLKFNPMDVLIGRGWE